MSSAKRTKEKKLSEEERERKELKQRHSTMMKEIFFTRTIPDNFQNSDDQKLGIPSYQNGVPISFRNESFPTSLKIKNDHNVNTQRSAEQSGLIRISQLDEKSTAADHIHNLKAALQSH